MIAQWLAVALASAVPASPTAPAQPSAAADAQELERLKAELPKPAKYAKLLNPADLASAMNYPREALEKDEEGRVRAWLLVGTNGQVERCGIEVSSGSGALDDQTCNLLIATAKFQAAKDRDGKAVRSIFHQPITWKLEDEPDPALMAEPEELERLKGELPKPAKYAKLLNSTGLATGMDYPKDALEKDEEGRVKAWLLVGTDGRVERCGIDTSSGSAALDAQTCNLLLANARFQPARDRRGRPVRSIFYQRMNWRLQDGPTMDIADLATRVKIVLGPASEIRSCEAEALIDGQWVESPRKDCDEYLKHHNVALAAAREKSKLHDAFVVSEIWSVTTPGKTIPNLGRRAGELLIGLRSASASYSAEGKRTRCTMGESFGFPGLVEDLCADENGGLPEQMPRPPGKPIENLRVLSAVYLKDEPN